MTFEVFVQSFQEGAATGIAREPLRAAFGVHLTETEPNLWQLRYDDTNWCDMYLTAHETDRSILSFMVSRPCDDIRLWDSLASILALGNLVLYFPGGRAPLVAHATVTQHLPPEMVEALGQPVIVRSGKEIMGEIRAN